MKTHVETVHSLFDDHPSMMVQMAKSMAVYHHEKWDGTGYGTGLKGESIPIEGRIVSLADVFDALTTKRPYKEAWSVDDAIVYIRDLSGIHFDPRLVDLFVENLPEVRAIMDEYRDVA